MLKSFFSKYYQLFIVIAVFSIVSCNDDANKKSTDDATAPVAPAAPMITGTLDHLLVDTAEFRNLDQKQNVVFSFTFGELDTVTLHGWSFKGSGAAFDTFPNIKLLKGAPSSFSYGPGVYFRNVVLDKKDVEKIINLFRTTKKVHYVLFAPEVSPIGGISYNIFLSDSSHSVFVKATAAADAIANPSPPKNY